MSHQEVEFSPVQPDSTGQSPKQSTGQSSSSVDSPKPRKLWVFKHSYYDLVFVFMVGFSLYSTLYLTWNFNQISWPVLVVIIILLSVFNYSLEEGPKHNSVHTSLFQNPWLNRIFSQGLSLSANKDFSHSYWYTLHQVHHVEQRTLISDLDIWIIGMTQRLAQRYEQHPQPFLVQRLYWGISLYLRDRLPLLILRSISYLLFPLTHLLCIYVLLAGDLSIFGRLSKAKSLMSPLQDYAVSVRRRGCLGWALLDELSSLSYKSFLVFLSLPAFLLLHFPLFVIGSINMELSEYGQHASSTPGSNLTNTASCYNPLFNFLLFNVGYHCEHHYKSNCHWTDLPSVRPKMLEGLRIVPYAFGTALFIRPRIDYPG
jgi:fatty acid desaturase